MYEKKTTFTADIAAMLAPDADVVVSEGIRRYLAEVRHELSLIRKWAMGFEASLKDLEGEDRLGNVEIQDLMSRFNQAETLASNMLKKRDDVANCIISNVKG